MKFRGFDETGRWYLKIIGLLALLLAIMKMTGCDERRKAPVDEAPFETGICKKVTFEGHDYLILKMSGYTGSGCLHSESCPCRKAERE